jgi:peptide deformylase
MKLALRYYGDPILRGVSEAIIEFDESLREFADAMIDTMRRESGIGLAAPQVGRGRRLIVALQMKDSDDVDAEAMVLVNPRVVSKSKDTWIFEEGCLSIPGVNAQVTRSVQVEVEYEDLEGITRHIDARDMFARILLHEIDHLDGRLFIDYLSSAQKSLIKARLKEIAQDKQVT